MNQLGPELYEHFNKNFPGIWATINRVPHDAVEKFGEFYAKTLQVSQMAKGNFGVAHQMVAVSYWAKAKVCYDFDLALSEEFLQQANEWGPDEKLPCNLLEHLPYPCLSINLPSFVWTRHDGTQEASFSGRMLVYNGWTDGHRTFCMIPEAVIDGVPQITCVQLPLIGTFGECIRELDSYVAGDNGEFEDTKIHQGLLYATIVAMQAVLYIMASNADIQRHPTATPKRSGNKSMAKPAKRFDVGYRVGKTIRMHSADSDSARTGTSHAGSTASKRPHARRGHWHHYWVGKHDSPERHLELKYLHPLIVNGEVKTTTVHPVKPPKKKKM